MSDREGYYIYDFERGQFWNQNQMGYTPNLKEAGRFNYEDAYEIVKNANIVKFEAEMIHCTDLERLLSIKDEVGVKDKPKIKDVIKKYIKPNMSFETNPVQHVVNDLEKAGYYFDKIEDRALSYNESVRHYLQKEGDKEGLCLVLSRKDNGIYNLIIYKTYPEIELSENVVDRGHDKRKRKPKR